VFGEHPDRPRVIGEPGLWFVDPEGSEEFAPCLPATVKLTTRFGSSFSPSFLKLSFSSEVWPSRCRLGKEAALTPTS